MVNEILVVILLTAVILKNSGVQDGLKASGENKSRLREFNIITYFVSWLSNRSLVFIYMYMYICIVGMPVLECFVEF